MEARLKELLKKSLLCKLGPQDFGLLIILLLDSLRAERDKLKAENERLKVQNEQLRYPKPEWTNEPDSQPVRKGISQSEIDATARGDKMLRALHEFCRPEVETVTKEVRAMRGYAHTGARDKFGNLERFEPSKGWFMTEDYSLIPDSATNIRILYDIPKKANPTQPCSGSIHTERPRAANLDNPKAE